MVTLPHRAGWRMLQVRTGLSPSHGGTATTVWRAVAPCVRFCVVVVVVWSYYVYSYVWRGMGFVRRR